MIKMSYKKYKYRKIEKKQNNSKRWSDGSELG